MRQDEPITQKTASNASGAEALDAQVLCAPGGVS